MILETEKISYDEYLYALEKVNRFHTQLKNEMIDVEIFIENSKDQQVNGYVINLLEKYATKRVTYAVSSFLESETAYRKIPFSSADTVTIGFFVTKYNLAELMKIRNLGAFSLLSINSILQQAGYTLSP